MNPVNYFAFSRTGVRQSVPYIMDKQPIALSYQRAAADRLGQF
jgi:hypothetical protein